MKYKPRRPLKRLGNKQFTEDIKKYIKYSHDFYSDNVPELKTLAKRLYDEHDLKDFYKVFNRLWRSKSPGETFLAIHALKLYKEDFNLNTWKFLKPKLKEIKSWDQVDFIAENIVGEIILKHPILQEEILKLSKSKNIWLKRMAIISMLPLIRDRNIRLSMKLLEMHVYSKEIHMQKAIGKILNEIEKINPEIARKFILKHMNMPNISFNYATENIRDLRKIKKAKSLKLNKRGFLFWR